MTRPQIDTRKMQPAPPGPAVSCFIAIVVIVGLSLFGAAFVSFLREVFPL